MATVRPALPADAAALTRLRALMFASMGTPVEQPDWEQASTEAFARRLATPGFRAYVVDGPDGLVAGGAGWVDEYLPSPRQLDGRRGHIASMSTAPAHRRQGHARAVLGALMAWFAEQGVVRVDLRATADGLPLYEAFGFRVLGGATMAWTAPGTSPGMPAT